MIKINTVKDLMTALGALRVNLNSPIYIINNAGTKTYKITSVLFQQDVEGNEMGEVYLSFGKGEMKIEEKK